VTVAANDAEGGKIGRRSDGPFFTSKAGLKQPVRQKFEKLATKGREERSLWWMEQDDRK